ncbi:hypothetical protein [Pseudoxanthomonas sp. JBR18]|uniref:hypothetical protein n=1 Tax=Pseudoxanthomonas sp. JBR18 TaxID=2969308 RepID=UPI0023053031|nr:hypothetical protein [Pseudoxanthomonas sp. JBR18]WCE06012.1 hypothetical protein PJ250_08710 [Pseudoxanthomonas sp. JBR18]
MAAPFSPSPSPPPQGACRHARSQPPARLALIALGTVLTQSLVLGLTRIALRAAFDAVLVMLAGSIAVFMAQRPPWQR